MQLDAKKSPLALLAQTCSSIGKDTTPSKSIIPPLEKEKKETDKSSEKSSSLDSKRPTSRDAKDGGRDSANKPGFRTVPPKEIPPLVPISSSEKSSSPLSVSETAKSMDNTTVTSAISRPVSATAATSIIGSNSRPRDDHRETSSAKSCHPHQTHSPLGHLSSKPNCHPQLSSLSGLAYPSLSLVGHGMPTVDAAMTNPSHTSPLAVHAGLGFPSVPAAAAAAAAAAQNSVLKASAASGLSPYVAYARVRTPSGATTLVPVCRDPYCTHCQLTLQNSHLSSTCTAPGCAQCAHEKSLQSLGSSLGLPGSSLPLYPSLAAQATSASGFASLPFSSSLYHPSMLSQQGLPLVCNWVAGNDYCGKRFTNSEELLQHLRSHTSCMDSVSLASYSALGFPPSVAAASLAACHGHLGNPAALSPNSLRRTYPTSLSPVSSILSANRYHPYKSPLGSVATVLTPTQQLTTAQYYPPYSLYGQRLGAAAVP